MNYDIGIWIFHLQEFLRYGNSKISLVIGMQCFDLSGKIATLRASLIQ